MLGKFKLGDSPTPTSLTPISFHKPRSQKRLRVHDGNESPPEMLVQATPVRKKQRTTSTSVTPMAINIAPSQLSHATPAQPLTPASPTKPQSRKRLTTASMLDMVFDAIDDANWTFSEFIMHASQEANRERRHAKTFSRFLQGQSRYTPAQVLHAWDNHPDGKLKAGAAEEDMMYSLSIPYTEIKSVRPALSSFAAQKCLNKLTSEAAKAVKPTSGLHVSDWCHGCKGERAPHSIVLHSKTRRLMSASPLRTYNQTNSLSMSLHPMSASDSEDDDFELELDDEGDGEEQEVGGPEDGTEEADDDSTDSTSSDDDDDDDDDDNDQNDNNDDNDNDMASRLQQELQESLAMEVEAELEADANELDAALLAAEPSTSSTHLTSSSDTLDGYTHSTELPPLPIPHVPDQDHMGYGASPGHSRASSRRGSNSPSPSSTVPSSAQRWKRSSSPASLRRAAIAAPIGLSSFTTRIPRTYTVEAICALPHPVPTHALASSFCMTHLLTGSDDGYIRDYDIFSAVNGKAFLSAPQRHHAGVVEGLMKAGQIRCWWENPSVARRGYIGGQAAQTPGTGAGDDDGGLAPVYSLLMQSDALWALAGTDAGHINLFTVRQEPGRLMHVMNEHKGPVSAMSMDYGEKGFFSASWDGEAIQWDLNTGSIVRNFTAHNSQLTAIAVRPAYVGPYFDPTPAPVVYRRKEHTNAPSKPAPPPPAEINQDQQMYRFSQDDINMTSPGNAGETNSLFGDDPQDDMDKDPTSNLPSSRDTMDVSMDYNPPGSVQALRGVPSSHPVGGPNPEGDDTKSDASFDSLFGGDGDETESKQTHPSAEQTPVIEHNPYNPASGISSGTQSSSVTSQFVTFPVGLSNPTNMDGQQTQQSQQGYFSTQTFSVQLTPQQPRPAAPHQPQPPPAVPASVARPKPAGPILPPKNAPPLLDNANYSNFSSDLLMTAFVDGQVILWDRRVSSPGKGVGRLWMSEKTPPWCLSACWSHDGGQIYAGRRNGTVDVWDVRLMGKNSMNNTPKLLKTLRNPGSSGVVSCVVPFPDCRHIATASVDNIRLWNVADAAGEDSSMARPRSGVPFKIIPGHHGGYISQMLIDPGARFMITASSNRGWHGDSTRTIFVHDIKLAY